MFPNIFNNDAAIKFFEENNYPREYNDGLYAYLRDIYSIFNTYSIPSLSDLLKRYLNDYGDTFNMIIAGKSAVAQSIIEPAATFTSTTPTDGGSGTIILTSAGVHGLTAAVSVGTSIYISAGTGWTPGFYPITAIDLDTTGVAITIEGTFDAGMGSPTIALENTQVTLTTVSIPALQDESMIRADYSVTSTDSSATQKIIRVRFDSRTYSSIALTTQPTHRKVVIIQNRGVTNSQVSGMAFGTAGSDGNTSAPLFTSTVDTSIPQALVFTAQPAAANTPITLERYFVEVFK